MVADHIISIFPPEFRRSSDMVFLEPRLGPDPLAILAAFRARRLSVEAAGQQIPLATLFEWSQDKTITQAEFHQLVHTHDVVEVAELPPLGPVADEGDSPVAAIEDWRILALKKRLETFTDVSHHDIVDDKLLSDVVQRKEYHRDGIGLSLLFRDDDDLDRWESLQVEIRVFAASTTTAQAVRAETLFLFPTQPALYFSVILPLPIYCRGRRRLFKSVMDASSKMPLNLPPVYQEMFQEPFLQQMVVRRRPPEKTTFTQRLKHRFSRLLRP